MKTKTKQTTTIIRERINKDELLKDFNFALYGEKELNQIVNNYDILFGIDEIKNKSFEIIEYYEKYYNNNDIENVFFNLNKIQELLKDSKDAIQNNYSFFQKIINFLSFKGKKYRIIKSFNEINHHVDLIKVNILKIKKFNDVNSKNINDYLSLIENRIKRLKEFRKILEKFFNDIKKKGNIKENLVKPFIDLDSDLADNLSSLIEIKEKLSLIKKVSDNNTKIINVIELKILIKLEPLIISIILGTNKNLLTDIKNGIEDEISLIENEGIKENTVLKLNKEEDKLKEILSIIDNINSINSKYNK